MNATRLGAGARMAASLAIVSTASLASWRGRPVLSRMSLIASIFPPWTRRPSTCTRRAVPAVAGGARLLDGGAPGGAVVFPALPARGRVVMSGVIRDDKRDVTKD